MKSVMRFLVDENFDCKAAIELLEAYGAKHLSTEAFTLTKAAPKQNLKSLIKSLSEKAPAAPTPRALGMTPHTVLLPLVQTRTIIKPDDFGRALKKGGWVFDSKATYLRDFVKLGYLEHVGRGLYRPTLKGKALTSIKGIAWPSSAQLNGLKERRSPGRAGSPG